MRRVSFKITNVKPIYHQFDGHQMAEPGIVFESGRWAFHAGEDPAKTILQEYLKICGWAAAQAEGTFEVTIEDLDPAHAPTAEKILALPSVCVQGDGWTKYWGTLAALVLHMIPGHEDLEDLAGGAPLSAQVYEHDLPNEKDVHAFSIRLNGEPCAIVVTWEGRSHRGRNWHDDEDFEVVVLDPEAAWKIVVEMVLPKPSFTREDPTHSIHFLEKMSIEMGA